MWTDDYADHSLRTFMVGRSTLATQLIVETSQHPQQQVRNQQNHDWQMMESAWIPWKMLVCNGVQKKIQRISKIHLCSKFSGQAVFGYLLHFHWKNAVSMAGA